MYTNIIYNENCLNGLKKLKDKSIDCCISSPPYFNQRNYNVEGQIGLETNYNDYINNLCNIYDEVYKVLKDEGSCYIVIGDTYKDKCLLQIPARFSIEMINRNWILRNEIIWEKPNAQPSPVEDRFTISHETIYFFVKNQKYFFNQQKEKCSDSYNGKRGSGKTRNKFQSAMRNNKDEVKIYKDRNIRTVWKINTKPLKDFHYASYPEELIIPMIKASTKEKDIIIDPFIGSGTTALSCLKLNRKYIGYELNNDYIKIAEKRIKEVNDVIKYKLF